MRRRVPSADVRGGGMKQDSVSDLEMVFEGKRTWGEVESGACGRVPYVDTMGDCLFYFDN